MSILVGGPSVFGAVAGIADLLLGAQFWRGNARVARSLRLGNARVARLLRLGNARVARLGESFAWPTFCWGAESLGDEGPGRPTVPEVGMVQTSPSRTPITAISPPTPSSFPGPSPLPTEHS
jgi:hypothetical protein